MSQQQYKVLVVDDDLKLRSLLERYLTEQGFVVRGVANGEQADRLLTRENFSLMVLDLMLPGEDGLSICRRLREAGNQIPVLMLTAKGDEVDRIVGLEMGADDYLPKPFNPRELLARIRAVLRRHTVELPGAPSAAEKVVNFGAFQLNLATRELSRDGEPMALTSGEFAVLKVLVSHPREPLSRDKLMNLARGREYTATERSIDVQVSRLRRLLEQDPASPATCRPFGVWGMCSCQMVTVHEKGRQHVLAHALVSGCRSGGLSSSLLRHLLQLSAGANRQANQSLAGQSGQADLSGQHRTTGAE